jgi:glutamate---cysteine ligase / carboxylate-amine ligase
VTFGQAAPGSLGVEEELFLVDAQTLEPLPLVAAVVPEPGPRLKHELFASVVEITTPICADAGEVLDELRRLRADAAARAAEHGVAILAAGTHPTARGAEQPIADDPLYRKIATELGPALSRQFVCGLHVHVAVPDEETCLDALESVMRFLPDVLSLSANSPFVDGADSGLRSSRADALAALPNGGAPPVFRTWADWEARTAGLDYRRLHWDVRPHPAYGTLEVRIADQQTDVQRSAAFAALIQALVRACGDGPAEPCPRELYAERRTRASALLLETAELAAFVEPAARELGTWGLVHGLLEARPEAERQLELGLPGVVRELADRSVASPS